MESEKPQPRRRNPWLAGIGNLFFPPLGHVYAGWPGRGALLYVGVTVIELMAFWTAARSVRMTSILLALAVSVAGLLWRIADAAIVARWPRRGARLRWYQRWYVYLATMALSYCFSVVTVSFITQFVAQSYYMPSGSMLPTIGIGDRFVVDKLSYRWKSPERNDAVILRAPPQASLEEKEFVKRVIGLPGETVAVVPDTLLVDGKAAVELNDDPGSTTSDFQHTRQRGLRWMDREHAPRVEGNQLSINGAPRVVVTPSGRAERRNGQLWVDGRPVVDLGSSEGLRTVDDLAPFGAEPGVQGSAYYVPESDQPALIVLKGKRLTLRPGWVSVNRRPLKEPFVLQTPRYEMPAWRIPAGSYFVLGDNRNDSNDSHAWGPVSRDRISGVAHMIFWSERPERIGRRL
jgi:signal peptidase I